MDVFATFNDLLTQVAASTTADEVAGAASSDGGGAMQVDSSSSSSSSSSCTALLLAEVPRVVKAVARQLKEKSSKTRIAAFHCIRQLVATLPGCLASHAATLIPGLDKALKDPTCVMESGSNPKRERACNAGRPLPLGSWPLAPLPCP